MNALLVLNGLLMILCCLNLYYTVREHKAIERKKRAEEKLAAIKREMASLTKWHTSQN